MKLYKEFKLPSGGPPGFHSHAPNTFPSQDRANEDFGSPLCGGIYYVFTWGWVAYIFDCRNQLSDSKASSFILTCAHLSPERKCQASACCEVAVLQVHLFQA
uniref:Uncharacterized protein n=1 Tax=Chlamydomonas chlamydogama TaxID=225041 RepID=A0A6T5UF50_9CHLO